MIKALFNIITLRPLWDNRPHIAVLSLNGFIGNVGMGKSGMSICGLNANIEKAFENPKTKAVCLNINSPGGSPVQSELIADRIMQLSKEKKIPVYAFVEDLGASGGYWLACAASEIYASKSSIIGSIGVITSGFGFQDMIKKMGIERRVVTQGVNKSMMDPFKPTKKQDIKILQQRQKTIHEHFIEHVKSSRKNRLKAPDDKLFNGEYWAGSDALEYGLIDGLDNMHNFVRQKFGEKARIEYIKPKESWIKRKFLSSITSSDIVDALYDKCEMEAIASKYKMY